MNTTGIIFGGLAIFMGGILFIIGILWMIVVALSHITKLTWTFIKLRKSSMTRVPFRRERFRNG